MDLLFDGWKAPPSESGSKISVRAVCDREWMDVLGEHSNGGLKNWEVEAPK
jgi:hypothetical protein